MVVEVNGYTIEPEANLEGANLSGAYLLGADLHRANLHRAKANKDTTWPKGFDPVTAGVVAEDDPVSKRVPFDKPSTLSESARTSIERNQPDLFANHPRAYSKWSPEEDAYLTELQEAGVSIKEICSILHRNSGAIRSRMRKLEIDGSAV